MTMEVLKRSRTALRNAVVSSARDLTAILAADPPDHEEVQVNWELMQQRFNELHDVDSQIFKLLSAGVEEEAILITDMNERDGYMKQYLGLKVKCLRLLKEEKEPITFVNTSGEVGTQGRRKFELPVIEFKKFDGSIKDWLSFWAQFKKIHEDVTIDENDKIEYLVQATVPGSRARQLVESYPAMRGNYAKIIDSMKTRFGRDDLQIEVYVRELLKLVLHNATSRNKVELSVLYDRIETQLRALDTLGITSDKCAAILYPLIESCLPEDLLRAWQRAANAAVVSTQAQLTAGLTLEVRLQQLMQFSKGEIENEQRITLASEGFGLQSASNNKLDDKARRSAVKPTQNIATATGLFNSNHNCGTCAFCEGAHDTESCFKAQKWPLDQKKRVLAGKRACYRCLKVGHMSKKCNSRLRCLVCEKSHAVIVCPDLPAHKKPVQVESTPVVSRTAQTLSNHSAHEVFLQTLNVELRVGNNVRTVRALINSGSQRSYLAKHTARPVGYTPKRKEKIIHGLFGGGQMKQLHSCYDVTLYKGSESCTIEVLDQDVICHSMPPVATAPWRDELKALNICLDDAISSGPIELLLGADVVGHIYTGRKQTLPCGLVAMDTIFGWTFMGKARSSSPHANLTLSCFVKHLSITGLWELYALGIKDPLDKSNREESAKAPREFFLETVEMNSEGRYEVRLPWLADHAPLPTNYVLSKRRLHITSKKLKDDK